VLKEEDTFFIAEYESIEEKGEDKIFS